MPGELNGESVIFLKVTPGYVEKAISSAKGKPNVTQVEPVFGRHDIAIRGFQTYPAVQEIVKIRPNGHPASGWVLVRTTDPQRVAGELKRIPGVEGLIATVGNYDLLARLGFAEPDALMTTVLRKVQTISGVRATETLPAFPSPM